MTNPLSKKLSFEEYRAFLNAVWTKIYQYTKEYFPQEKLQSNCKISLFNSIITPYDSATNFRHIIIKIAPKIVQGIPKIKVWPDVFLNKCHSVLKALSNISAGKNIAIIPLGLSWLIRTADFPIKDKCSWKYPMQRPVITNNGL